MIDIWYMSGREDFRNRGHLPPEVLRSNLRDQGICERMFEQGILSRSWLQKSQDLGLSYNSLTRSILASISTLPLTNQPSLKYHKLSGVSSQSKSADWWSYTESIFRQTRSTEPYSRLWAHSALREIGASYNQ